jgi:hypothetical protein
MKTKAVLIVILLILAGSSSSGEPSSPSPPPNALVIVVDTSWSCDRWMGDFRTLARQAALTLRPGDYLEIIAARPGNPTIKLAQTVRSDSAEDARSIDAALAAIRAQFLSEASLADALEMALERLTGTCSKKGIANTVTITFTDGQMGDNEAKRVLELSEKFDTTGCQLYLTGTRNTNRNILIAASKKNKLKWFLIREANPGIWLQAIVEKHPVTEAKQEQAPQPKSSELAKAEEKIGTQPEESQTTKDKPQDQITGQPQAQTPEGSGYHITVGSTVEVSPLTRPPGSEITVPPQGLPLEANEPSGPVAEQQPVVEPVEQPPEKVEVPQRSFWAWLKRAFHGYWWLIPTAVVLAGLVLVISQSIAQARKWDGKVKASQKTARHNDPEVLVATSNGQSYQLGPPSSFHSANIGKGVGNAIRIADDSLEDRHARLYRKRTNFLLKNSARSPVTVNGSQIKPGGKCRLVLPSVIQLNDKTKLNLLRQKAGPSENRSDKNEPGK